MTAIGMREGAILSELIQGWEQRYPADWALCYPKQYQVSGVYPSPKELAVNLIEFRAPQTIRPHNILVSKGLTRLAWFAAATLINLRVPIFFVAPDLLTAVRESIPPVDLDWINLKLPFDGAAFALPKGSLTHTSRGEVGYIWYARIRKGQPFPTYPGLDPIGISDDDCFMVFASCIQSPNRKVLSNILLGSRTPTVKLEELNCESESDDPIVLSKAGLVAGDTDMLSEASTLLFNLLFVMNARSELCEYGHWTGKRSQRGLEFWTPNILGKNYVLKKPAPSGNGISPRMHWRRGHMRQQAYGERHALRRSQWIEPALVSAE